MSSYARLCVAIFMTERCSRIVNVGKMQVFVLVIARSRLFPRSLSQLSLSESQWISFDFCKKKISSFIVYVFTIGKDPMLLELFITRGHCLMTLVVWYLPVVFWLYEESTLLFSNSNFFDNHKINLKTIHVLSDNPLRSNKKTWIVSKIQLLPNFTFYDLFNTSF